MAIFKFADPISCGLVSLEYNCLFTASWDKMIRVVDLESNKVNKSFIGSKEAIKTIALEDDLLFVAGCDPLIRCFNMTNGETKVFSGHKGWVYTIKVLKSEEYGDRLFSGGDDRTIIIWDIEKTKALD